MVRSGVRGEGARPRVRQADDLGWNDSLYDKNGDPADGGEASGGGGGGATDKDSGSTGSRHSGGGGRRRGGGGHPRRRRRILRWSASVLAVLILGTAGAGYLYYQHLNDNIKKDDLNLGDEKDRAAKSKANAAGQTP